MQLRLAQQTPSSGQYSIIEFLAEGISIQESQYVFCSYGRLSGTDY